MIKLLNSYKITHSNNSTEIVNAKDIATALKNVALPEEESPVVSVIMTQRDIRVNVPDTVYVRTVALNNKGDIIEGCYTSPQTATCLAGEEMHFIAQEIENMEFVEWQNNGVTVATERELVCTFEEMNKEETIIIKAVYKPVMVRWSVQVSPEGALDSGCKVYPATGEIVKGDLLQVDAIESTTYEFDKWAMLDGSAISSNKILVCSIEEDIQLVAHFKERT